MRRLLLALLQRLERWLHFYDVFNKMGEDLLTRFSLLLKLISVVGSFSILGEVKLGEYLGWVPADSVATPVALSVKLDADLAFVDMPSTSQLDCGVRAASGERLIVPRVIGPFSEASPRYPFDSLDAGTSLKTEVSAMLQGIAAQSHDGHHVRRIVLIGAADVHQPGGSLDNGGIARWRAFDVEQEIESQWHGEAPPTVLLAVRGADKVEYGGSVARLAWDRYVEVCVAWG